MYCKKCGTQISDGSEFCSKCGAKQDYSSDEPSKIDEKPILESQEKEKPKKKTGCFVRLLQIIGGIIILSFIGSCISGTGGNNETKNSTKTEVTQQKQEKKADSLNYTCNVDGIGKVKGMTKSNVGVAIAKIQEMPTIDGSFSSTRAQGVFKVLYVVASNHQKDAVTIDANSFKLIDNKGREFSHSVEGDTALQMSNRETLFLKQINPGITVGGYVAYDVPKDANIATLAFRGGFSGDKGELPFKVILE